jgi:hypothetical protein
MRGGEVRIQAQFHPSGQWITVPITIHDQITRRFVLDTGSPLSALSQAVEHQLQAAQLLQPSPISGRYMLGGLAAAGQSLPTLQVGVLKRLDRLQIDGLLGLDFLVRFEHVHFHVRTLELVLEFA